MTFLLVKNSMVGPGRLCIRAEVRCEGPELWEHKCAEPDKGGN